MRSVRRARPTGAARTAGACGVLLLPRGRVHQAGRLERGSAKLAITVLQDGTPSMGYGEATVAGVTRRLLSSH